MGSQRIFAVTAALPLNAASFSHSHTVKQKTPDAKPTRNRHMQPFRGCVKSRGRALHAPGCAFVWVVLVCVGFVSVSTVHTVRVDTVHLAGSGPQTPTLTLGVGTEALHLHFSPLLLAKDPLHLHFSPLLVNHGPLSHDHCLGH